MSNSKRLSRYCKLNIIQVADEKTIENSTEKEMDIIKAKEGRENSQKYSR